ncbi:MAG TPA: hypothetical protein VIW70_04835 [Rubrivivax sp.]
MNKIKVWGGSVLAAAAVAACGGDVIAVLGALGAAGGDFTLDANPATAQLETRLSDPGNPFSDPLGINIQVDDGANGGLGENLFDESFPVRVNSGSLGGANCAGVTGRITGDRLDLGNCFRGRYENVNRVVSDDGTVVLRFDSFSPNLSIGIWVDIQQTSRRIKFISNSAGCELKSGTPTGNAVTVEQVDSDASTGAIDSMKNFRIGDRVWAQGEYVGASGLRLTGGQDTLELERRRDDPETACP